MCLMHFFSSVYAYSTPRDSMTCAAEHLCAFLWIYLLQMCLWMVRHTTSQMMNPRSLSLSLRDIAVATSSTNTVLIYLNLIHYHIILLFIWIRVYSSPQLVPSPKFLNQPQNPEPQLLKIKWPKTPETNSSGINRLTPCLLQTTMLYKSSLLCRWTPRTHAVTEWLTTLTADRTRLRWSIDSRHTTRRQVLLVNRNTATTAIANHVTRENVTVLNIWSI